MSRIIRAAAKADIGAMLAIGGIIDKNPYLAGVISEAVVAGLAWVCEEDGSIHGAAAVSRHFFGSVFLELLNVAETAQRRGVGDALLTFVESWCLEDRLFASTTESNAPMRALLSKRGYRASGFVDNLDPGDPELFFVKFL